MNVNDCNKYYVTLKGPPSRNGKPRYANCLFPYPRVTELAKAINDNNFVVGYRLHSTINHTLTKPEGGLHLDVIGFSEIAICTSEITSVSVPNCEFHIEQDEAKLMPVQRRVFFMSVMPEAENLYGRSMFLTMPDNNIEKITKKMEAGDMIAAQRLTVKREQDGRYQKFAILAQHDISITATQVAHIEHAAGTFHRGVDMTNRYANLGGHHGSR